MMLMQSVLAWLNIYRPKSCHYNIAQGLVEPQMNTIHSHILCCFDYIIDPPDQEKLEASYISTGVLAGATAGTFLLILLIEGTVLIVLYRKGYRVGNILKGASRKSSSHPEPVEMDNRGYSSLDQIAAPAQYSNMEEESEKQQYTQLKIYENTKDDAADRSTYEGVTETPPVTYESISVWTYQNTGAHSPGLDHGNN
ncbi:uncharacterized protein LOC124264779 isoform X2 [Haliotis rubra]|uniref:uncharacterized protein LOC124264779 isoform X2 n=1 Tax=Haliotis rubra TaxID=36100 RepID=UPI001EE6144E|nr:uncharacterized protein LOC124264779 isoform X2 [Haliotis rubra]